MPSDDENENLYNDDIFQEPEGYYQQPPAATSVTYRLGFGQVLTLRLVGHNPLWGHVLWNAGKTVARYLENNASTLVKGKTVLELGAGAGLPSLVCALMGAQNVVVTDYPDTELIDNLRHNISSCLFPESPRIAAQGHLWGNDPSPLLSESLENSKGFDLLILADLLFNHSEHQKLLSTIQSTLRKSSDAQALVFFTPHRPWLYDKDMAFFDLARNGGFVVEKILEHRMETVMFDTDPGDEDLRRTVFGYRLCWAEVRCSATV